MNYRRHDPPEPLLFGYDPVRDLAPDHLARLVELVVEEALPQPPIKSNEPGQPAYDPRLLAKVLTYGYSTGVRSSRQLERMCKESLPYLFLTRGEAPSYRTLCNFRVEHEDILELVWLSLFRWASKAGMNRLGRIVVDSSKFRADASSESVVKAEDFTKIREVLERILEEAKAADAHDELEPPGQTQIGLNVDSLDPMQMRDVIRSVKKSKEAVEASETKKPPLGPRMVPRIEAAIEAIKEAEADGRKHVCLTDSDARMMGEGREKRIRECHSFEVAVDSADGLLVAAQSTNTGTDNSRLLPLVEAAKEQEPDGIVAVDADSGYYSGDNIAGLIQKGIDTCIPNSNTACDLHRKQPIGTTRNKVRGQVEFTYDRRQDCYECPKGNTLRKIQERKQRGQTLKLYRAEHDCCACPLKSVCLTQAKAKRRTLKVGVNHAILEAALQRFGEAEHRERYSHRGEVVESVFGFLRSVLGFHRWSLRGSERVSCEASLFKLAYQMRKVHIHWRQTVPPAPTYAYPTRR